MSLWIFFFENFYPRGYCNFILQRASRNIIQLNEEAVKGEIRELVKNSVEETLNELLNKEAEELTRAGRYERTEARQGYRSGHYSRKLMTTAGEVRLEIPKLKGIPFETAIIERYRRRESSVEEALIEMYLAGVSVRRVEDISEALWGSRVSGCHHQRSESESLRPYRRMAQPSARREVSIRLRRRYLPQAQLGRRIRERQHSGGHRRG